MRIKLDEPNYISAVFYNMLRQADILYEIHEDYLQFFNEDDYKKALEFKEKEPLILEEIEKKLGEEIDPIPAKVEKKQSGTVKKRSLF